MILGRRFEHRLTVLGQSIQQYEHQEIRRIQAQINAFSDGAASYEQGAVKKLTTKTAGRLFEKRGSLNVVLRNDDVVQMSQWLES
jgi:hypothetical protein